MKIQLRNLRNQRGAAMLALVLTLFLFVALAGFFAFDASRAQMAKRELVASCDAAALAGTAMLATYDTSPGSGAALGIGAGATQQQILAFAQNNAAAYGLNMFQKGSLLGKSLSTSTYVTTPGGLTPSPGQCRVLVALSDPNNGFNGVNAGDPNGRAISVFAAYGYVPSFMSAAVFGGVPLVGNNYILNASSTGGLPQVDAVMVFDFSGSMDDFTKVSFIMRCWDGPAMRNGLHTNLTRYFIIPSANTNTTISNYLDWDYSAAGDPAGSPVNVLPPQNLASAGGNPPPVVAGPQRPVKWEFLMRSPFRTFPAGLSNGPFNDYGCPPSDCTLPLNLGGFVKTGLKYQGGFTPTPAAVNWAIADAFPSGASDGTNADTPFSPYLFRYDPGYNPATTPSPALTAGNPYQGPYTNNASPGYGAWVTYDQPYLNSVPTYTDLVVNIADPGNWPYTQPISQPDSQAGTAYPGFSYTFPPYPSEPCDSAHDAGNGGIAGATFSFPNMATIVEASRGNLDNRANFDKALPSPYRAGGLPGRVIDVDGVEKDLVRPAAAANIRYQLAYQRLAMLESQPFATALDGAENGFFFKLNGLADCRFGFVGFSAATHSSANNGAISNPGPNFTTRGTFDNYSWYRSFNAVGGVRWNGLNTAGADPAKNTTAVAGSAGASGFRLPRVRLNSTLSNMNQVCSHVFESSAGSAWQSSATNAVEGGIWNDTTNLANGLWNGRPMNDTHTEEALNTAVRMFTNNAGFYAIAQRPASRKAIVFFTDGEPTGGIAGTDANNAKNIATTQAKPNGIAIFTIGLNVSGNPLLTSDQNAFLGDGVTGGTGLAKLGGNGGKFFPCANAQAVRQAFTNVARRLSQNQQ